MGAEKKWIKCTSEVQTCAISHAMVITYKAVYENNLQKGGLSDLHKLRYSHLETTSRQMPKRMRDQAERLTNSPKEIIHK